MHCLLCEGLAFLKRLAHDLREGIQVRDVGAGEVVVRRTLRWKVDVWNADLKRHRHAGAARDRELDLAPVDAGDRVRRDVEREEELLVSSGLGNLDGLQRLRILERD